MIDRILKRANIESLSYYILYGGELLTVDKCSDYNTVMKSAHKNFRVSLKQKLQNKELENEIAEIILPMLHCFKTSYLNIGVQVGKQLKEGIDRI